MKRMLGALTLSLWVPCVALAATWEKAPLVDRMCSAKMKDHPDDHPTSCLLKCADSGYGIQAGGKWIKLDGAGNEMALAELKKTKKSDHIRVDVTGEQKGDVIAVSSLKISD